MEQLAACAHCGDRIALVGERGAHRCFGLHVRTVHDRLHAEREATAALPQPA